MKVLTRAMLVTSALLAACDRAAPTAVTEPGGGTIPNLAALACRAEVRTGEIRCGAPELGATALVVGGQGVYVFLGNSTPVYNPVDSTFSFDATVQNLIPQALGTEDGVSAHADGVRVGFMTTPTVTGGSGAVAIVNSDGEATFTAAGQPYYQYAGILAPNQTSAARTWIFRVDPEVQTFAFMVVVGAAVQFPDGWVDLGTAADTLLAGATRQLTPTVRSVVGVAVPGETVTWGTGDAAVATVDGAGLLSGVAPGATTVTATAGVRTGMAQVAVCPDLPVGGVYTATMPGAASLCLAGGTAGTAEYTYMPINFSSAAALSLTLTGSGIVGVTGPPTPDFADMAPALGRGAPARMHTDEPSHGRHLERDRLLGERLMRDPSSRVRPAQRQRSGPSRLIVPGVPAVGDLWNLNVASGCSGSRDDRVGRVVSVGDNIIIVSDTTNPPGGFTTAQYDSIRMEFDTLAHGVNVNNFGAPTDLDGNQRVVAFYTRAVNELSPPASSVVVAGYVTSRDLFSSAPTSCPRSNEGEIFYMLVPDPTGAVNSNVRTVSFVRGGTVGTLAHEFQHLINASRRIYINEAPGLEEVWLNEGLSHIAEELMFYRTSVGLTPGGNIALSTLTTGPNASRRVAAFNSYANQNFGRMRSWLQRPDTAGPIKNTDVLAVRGATWGFLRYAADRHGGTESNTWFSLVNSLTAGTANLQTVFGVDPTLWTRDWIAAMYADDAVVGAGAEYQNPSWNFRSVYGGLGGFPLGTRALSNGVGLTLSYSRGGATAYGRFGVAQDAFAGITALSGGVPPATPYGLIVMRTK